MPKILSYTPSWLTRPSPGYALFSQKPREISAGGNGQNRNSQESRVRRIIAHRGTEVFVVVDNEIRWSDLVMLRERSEEAEQKALNYNNTAIERNIDLGQHLEGTYRVLRVPVSGEIKQLTISPAEDYMAIATSHTIQVAVLPNSSHLTGIGSNPSPIRPRTFQLGPTAHVLERASVCSVLWHPLGQRGRTLVTVTEDAVVRLWDVNKDDRWSFAEPALAIDLRKLVSMRSIAALSDVLPREYGDSKTFSPDYVEMEVAAACFGRESKGTDVYGDGDIEDYGDGWAPMTLYVAMKAGDVYALCPLLPARWQATTSLLQSLGAAVAAHGADFAEDDGGNIASPDTEQQQQNLWLKEILNQEPVIEQMQIATGPIETYRRPSWPGIVPALQGPFDFHPSMEDDADITDMAVLEPSSMIDDTDDMWDTFAEGSKGSSMAVMALATKDGKIHICLQLDGVEGRWLPRDMDGSLDDEENIPKLLTLETIQLHARNAKAQQCHSMLTKDINSNYSFFITNESGLFSISIAPWARALERELMDTGNAGADFRIDLLLRGMSSDVQALVQMPQKQLGRWGNSLSACTVLEDSDLGHFMLAEVNGQPFAVTLASVERGEMDLDAALDLDLSLTRPMGSGVDDSSRLDDFTAGGTTVDDIDGTTTEGAMIEFRPKYQPPEIFWQRSALRSTVEGNLQKRQQGKRHQLLSEEIRLSVATLELMTEAHRTLSTETHHLGIAVADLFRRCERLRDEFAEQIGRVDELATRIEGVIGCDVEDDDGLGSDEDRREEGEGDEVSERRAMGTARIEQRMDRARQRQTELTARHREIRRRLSKLGAPPLTKAEHAWASEVEELQQTIVRGGNDEMGRRANGYGNEDASASMDERGNRSSLSSSISHNRPGEKSRLDEVKKVASELVQKAKQAAKTETERESQRGNGGRSGSREGSASLIVEGEEEEAGEHGSGLVTGSWLGRLGGSEMGSRRGSGTGSGSEGAEGGRRRRRSRQGSRQSIAVPDEIRRARVGEVMEMLERESALVEATAERLHRLSVQAI